MKITRSQLRKLIQEATISEMPMIKPGGDMSPDHYEKIKSMIDTGDEESIRQADELASMVGHDSDNLSQDLQQYNTPHLNNPDFNKYLELVMSAWIYINKDYLVWGIENDSNSLDELTELYFDYDDFVYTLFQSTEAKNQEWINQVRHTFPKPKDGTYEFDHNARLKNLVTSMFKEEMRPLWKDWRNYFKLPINI